MTQKELNQTFDEQPDYEVGEFVIYRDGQLDRVELYKARTAHVAAYVGEVAAYGTKRALSALGAFTIAFAEGLSEAAQDLDQNGLKYHRD